MQLTRVTIAALAMGSILLTSCAAESTGVTLPRGSESLAPCPVTTMSLDDLSARGAPNCDLVGTMLTFPDDAADFAIAHERDADGAPVVIVSTPGATESASNGTGREVMTVNWGVPGVAVAAIEDGRLVTLWASTDEARDLHLRTLALDGVRAD